MFPFDIEKVQQCLFREIEYREKKQKELDTLNRNIKIMGRILEYKGKQNVGSILKDTGFTKVKRFFHKKNTTKRFDMHELGFDIAYFSNRIKNLSEQQRQEFYQVVFGTINHSVRQNFIRDIETYKKLAMKYNPSTIDVWNKRKYLINITTSLSMMFDSYHKLQQKQVTLRQELSNQPMIGQLKRLSKKLELSNQNKLTEKDTVILTSLLTSKKKEKKKMMNFIKKYNAEWEKKQKEKKETLKTIKSLEVKNRTISKQNIILVREESLPNFTIELVEEEPKENEYVSSLLELLKLEPNLDTMQEYLPTIEFQDYYMIKNELLDKVEQEIVSIKQLKKQATEDEISYFTEELTTMQTILNQLIEYFDEYEKEEQEELQEQMIEKQNQLLYVTNASGISYFMKDIKNELEKDQIPYLLKAIQRVKQGMNDFDTRKLNKFKEGKGFLGADDVFEAKAGQVRVLFQYLGGNKVAILMYFNKKSNRTTSLLHEMMKERITNCQEQVEYFRKKVVDGTFDEQVLDMARKEEECIMHYLETKDKTLRKKYL